MRGERIVEVLRDSMSSVLRTHGIDPLSVPLEEMARNAACILHAELQAELAETVDTSLPE